MQNRKRKTLSALVMLTVCVSTVWADDAKGTAVESAETVIETTETTVEAVKPVEPAVIDYVAISARTMQKLHADAALNTGQQAQIAELTLAYFHERQAVLDVPARNRFSYEVITLLKTIEDRYQEEVDKLLSDQQRETVNAKREERKNEVLREVQAVASEAAPLMREREETNEETSNQ